MSSAMTNRVNGILEQFADHVGLDECYLSEDGTVELALDDIYVTLLLDEEKELLLILAAVGEPEASAEVYGRLLDANLFWSGTTGGTVARDGDKLVVLQRSLLVSDLDIQMFEEALRETVETAERLRGALVVVDKPNGHAQSGFEGQSQEHVVRG